MASLVESGGQHQVEDILPKEQQLKEKLNQLDTGVKNLLETITGVMSQEMLYTSTNPEAKLAWLPELVDKLNALNAVCKDPDCTVARSAKEFQLRLNDLERLENDEWNVQLQSLLSDQQLKSLLIIGTIETFLLKAKEELRCAKDLHQTLIEEVVARDDHHFTNFRLELAELYLEMWGQASKLAVLAMELEHFGYVDDILCSKLESNKKILEEMMSNLSQIREEHQEGTEFDHLAVGNRVAQAREQLENFRNFKGQVEAKLKQAEAKQSQPNPSFTEIPHVHSSSFWTNSHFIIPAAFAAVGYGAYRKFKQQPRLTNKEVDDLYLREWEEKLALVDREL